MVVLAHMAKVHEGTMALRRAALLRQAFSLALFLPPSAHSRPPVQ